MSEFLILTKAQFKNFIFKRSSKKGLKIGSAFFTFILLFGLSIYYAFLYIDLFGYDKSSFFPYFIAYFAFLMTFIFGISNSQGMLFGFKDIDLLRSFPIKNHNIVLSKVIVYILIEYIYTLLFLMPALIIYGYRIVAGFTYYLYMVLGFISFPIIPLLLAATIGIFVKYISAGKKYSNLIQNLGTILFVGLIYFVSFKLGYSQGEGTSIDASYADIYFKYLFTCNWYIIAMLDNKFFYIILNTIIAFALLFIAIRFYGNNIIKINEKSNLGYHNTNFQFNKSIKSKSTFVTLLSKEFKKVFSNFMYLLNTSIGMIMLMLTSFYLCFFLSDEIKSMINSLSFLGQDIKTIIWQSVTLIVFLVSQMTCTTHVSISLEGKAFWLLKTLPITIKDIFISKILVNIMIIVVPSFITLLLFGITFHFEYIYYLVGIIFIILAAIFVSCLGLVINLYFPKLDFDNESSVIKRSLASFLGTFVPFVIAIINMILYFKFIDTLNLYYVIMFIYLILDIILIIYLYIKGPQRFFYIIN